MCQPQYKMQNRQKQSILSEVRRVERGAGEEWPEKSAWYFWGTGNMVSLSGCWLPIGNVIFTIRTCAVFYIQIMFQYITTLLKKLRCFKNKFKNAVHQW